MFNYKGHLEKTPMLENLEKLGDFDHKLTDQGPGGLLGTLMMMQH